MLLDFQPVYERWVGIFFDESVLLVFFPDNISWEAIDMSRTKNHHPLMDNPRKGIMEGTKSQEGGFDMSIYLNPDNIGMQMDVSSPNFVDKSMLIQFTNARLNTSSRFLCVTRPRRFGKTVAVNMLSSYYSMGCKSGQLFHGLRIEKEPSFEKHLNRHYVIVLDIAGIIMSLRFEKDPIRVYEKSMVAALKEDFEMKSSATTLSQLFKEIYARKGIRFIILIDEWDAVFRDRKDNKRICDSYMEFLRSLFKDINVSQSFELVYMTGIFPITRYNTESTLNMFDEYTVLDDSPLTEFFGFTQQEVDVLCEKNDIDKEQMRKWYDGYHYGGMSLYSPYSVIKAIIRRSFKDYWTATTSVESVMEYMNYDGGILKESIVRMMPGDRVKFNPDRFKNGLSTIDSQDAALTILVHLGYLGYDPDRHECYIPNREIRQEFELDIEELKDWKDVNGPLEVSSELVERTFREDTSFINETFDEFHRLYADTFTKNLEAVLSMMTRLLYYKLGDDYERMDEVANIKGRADIVYRPRKNDRPALIIELKADDTSENAIRQIEEMDYVSSLKPFAGEAYLLGISYDRKTLKHQSLIKIVDVG